MRWNRKENHFYESGKLKSIEHVLEGCPLHSAGRDLLRIASLIETNIFEISCLLCMSFCFVILYVTIWCKDNKQIFYSIYNRVERLHKNQANYQQRSAIERLNSLHALTPLLCQSHRDKCFWNFMSSLYIVLFCKIFM